MGIGKGDLTSLPVMAKQRAETSRREWLAAVRAFEGNEHRSGIAERPL